MVGPRPPLCNCRCTSPLAIQFARHCKLRGEVTAEASLSGHTEAWTAWEAGVGNMPSPTSTPFGGMVAKISGTDLVAPHEKHWLMKPVRYSFASATEARYGRIVTHQHDGAARAGSPVLDGHLHSTTLTSFVLPNVLEVYNYVGFTPSPKFSASTIVGAAIWKNSTLLELFTFSPQWGVNQVVWNTWWFPDLHLTLATPVTLIESDVISVDLYLRVQDITGVGVVAATIAALARGQTPLKISGFSGQTVDPLFPLNATSTQFGSCCTTSKKLVFSSDGPGGVTELVLKAQTGWTFYAGSGLVQLTHISSGDQVNFVWARETPYIEIIKPAEWNIPGGALEAVRYTPEATSDYDPIVIGNGTDTATVEPGIWDDTAATVFEHRVRKRMPYLTQMGQWAPQGPGPFYTLPASYFTEWPTTISLEAV